MSIEGYVDYQRREFCNDVECSVQIEMNSHQQGSEAYERSRRTCTTDCVYTTWQFHQWLIEKGYLVVRPQE